jgi:Rrf2 family protein
LSTFNAMLSNRAKYATRAILDLTAHYDEGPILIQDIHKRQNIPLKFLEQILLTLKHAGFVDSRKGRGGGYFLARTPAKITLGSVVRAIDGPLAPISCVSVTAFHDCGCLNPKTCGLRTAWQEARNSLADVLDRVSFSEILERQHRLESETAEVYDYTI